MGDAFVSQPEFFEVDVNEGLQSRTETLASFRELGPPDLCHVIKTTGRAGAKEVCISRGHSGERMIRRGHSALTQVD